MSDTAIYLDNNATTRLDPAAREALLPWLGERFGNPSSQHGPGHEAREAVERARAAVARLVGARSAGEIVFTSCGTESIHTALLGSLAARAADPARRRAVTSRAEHAATSRCLEGAPGVELVAVPVDGAGRVDAEALLAQLDGRCAVVSLILANNETGVLQDEDALRAIGAACRERGAALHLDAVQMAGKLPLALADLPVDLASFSAHKLHGPTGVGALWVRAGTPLAPLLRGGPQEDERRAGTQNVAGIVGFGRAAERAREELGPGSSGARTAVDAGAERATGPARIAALRDRLEAGLLRFAPDARVHGAGMRRLPNTSSVAFPGVDGDALQAWLAELGVAVSTGAACGSGRRGPSAVLLALGASPAEATSTLRFSLSRETTTEEIDAALERVETAWRALRALAPV